MNHKAKYPAVTDPIGAVFWNLLYPGHIHLPTNTAYPAVLDGFNCLVILVAHYEPVVVTDFDNDLVIRKIKSGKCIFWSNLNTYSDSI